MNERHTENVTGVEVVDVRYTGDYYHPFEYELDNGTVIMGVVK